MENKDIILAQWQTCVEMANSISQRRDTLNNLFVTLNMAILTAISIIWDLKSLIISLLGVLLCFAWIFLLRNFRILNSEKFKVINDIENKLPEKPFIKEWELLKDRKYIDGTILEYFIPSIFIVSYIVLIIILICNYS